MTVVTSSAACAGCGTAIAVDAPREPCATCGSTGRNYSVGIQDKLTLRGSLRAKLKRPSLRGQGRNRKGVGVDYRDELVRRKDNGEWVRVQRRIDRIAKWYDEIVSDPKTGAILHECHEPLDQHEGRGSASAAARRKREQQGS